MNRDQQCFFCDIKSPKNKIIFENDVCYARWDNFPVSKGHAEIVPKEHIESIFDLKESQLTELFSMLSKTKKLIQDVYDPDGYNIGINEGESAGRTVHHLHIHLIPRYRGDVVNPRGGVRNIIPGKGDY